MNSDLKMAPAVALEKTTDQQTLQRWDHPDSNWNIAAMQTPQAARRDLLEIAYARVGDELATDEVGLLQRAGVEVVLVKGDTRNVKLTRPEDWETALAIWPGWQEAEGGRDT